MTAKADTNPLREAVEGLFAGGFIDAGWNRVGTDSQDAQWALELEHRLKPIRAALASEPVAGTESGPDLKLLPEDADERRMVDETCASMGWTALEYVANSLYLERNTAPQFGSFRAFKTIAFNEVTKAIKALSAPPAPTGREAIAKLIDPGAFESWQHLYDFCIKDGNDADFATRCADQFYETPKAKAFERADAILGATVPPQVDCAIPIDLMQRIWANLFYDEEEAGNTFQHTINEVVDWLAARNALPSPDALPDLRERCLIEREVLEKVLLLHSHDLPIVGEVIEPIRRALAVTRADRGAGS